MFGGPVMARLNEVLFQFLLKNWEKTVILINPLTMLAKGSRNI